MNYDPYDYLGVRHGDDLGTIREVFKRLVLKYHPDKPAGNIDKFVKIKEAYTFIYKHKKALYKNTQRSKRNIEELEKERNDEDKLVQGKVFQNKMDKRLFNRIFSRTKLPDAYAVGREQLLKSDKHTKPDSLTVYKDPSTFTGSFLGNVRHLGVDNVDDFSTYRKGIVDKRNAQLSDIKHAYSDAAFLEKNMKNVRQDSFLTRDTDLKDRPMSFPKYTEKEKRLSMVIEKEEQEKEDKRLTNIRKQQELAERQFLRISRFITN